MRKLLSILLLFFVFSVMFSPASFARSRKNLTGTWTCNDGGTYYITQVGHKLFWYGEKSQTHPEWANIFTGSIHENLVKGSWVDVPKGTFMHHGSLTVRIEAGGRTLKLLSQSGGFKGSTWTKGNGAAQTLSLTDIPAKAILYYNSIVVVNNAKANIINTPSTLWQSIDRSKIKNALSGNWTPPMDINGQTYNHGYFFQTYNGGRVSLVWWLDHRGFTTLTTTLGLDDHVDNDNQAVFKVVFLGNGRILKTVQVDSSNNPIRVTVPITGIHTLKIKIMPDNCHSCFPSLDIVQPSLQK